MCTGQAAGFLTIQQVRDLDLGHGEKADYFSCKSTITFCQKDRCLYKVNTTHTSLTTHHIHVYHSLHITYMYVYIIILFFLKACQNVDCNKKVTEHDGQYTCEKCNQTSPDFKYRIILSVSLIPPFSHISFPHSPIPD